MLFSLQISLKWVNFDIINEEKLLPMVGVRKYTDLGKLTEEPAWKTKRNIFIQQVVVI